MKMYRILLAFLAIILACSAQKGGFDEKTKEKIKTICKQTEDTKFCTSIFANALIKFPSPPTNKDLLNVTARQSERLTANTYFYISTLLRNAGDEKPSLQMCADAYSNIDLAFMKIVVYFDDGEYDKFPSLEDKVITSLDICKTNFTVSGFKINPLIAKKRNTVVLVNVVKIVAGLVSL